MDLFRRGEGIRKVWCQIGENMDPSKLKRGVDDIVWIRGEVPIASIGTGRKSS